MAGIANLARCQTDCCAYAWTVCYYHSFRFYLSACSHLLDEWTPPINWYSTRYWSQCANEKKKLLATSNLRADRALIGPHIPPAVYCITSAATFCVIGGDADVAAWDWSETKLSFEIFFEVKLSFHVTRNSVCMLDSTLLRKGMRTECAIVYIHIRAYESLHLSELPIRHHMWAFNGFVRLRRFDAAESRWTKSIRQTHLHVEPDGVQKRRRICRRQRKKIKRERGRRRMLQYHSSRKINEFTQPEIDMNLTKSDKKNAKWNYRDCADWYHSIV